MKFLAKHPSRTNRPKVTVSKNIHEAGVLRADDKGYLCELGEKTKPFEFNEDQAQVLKSAGFKIEEVGKTGTGKEGETSGKTGTGRQGGNTGKSDKENTGKTEKEQSEKTGTGKEGETSGTEGGEGNKQ